MAKRFRPNKMCCESSLRCRNCPVVWKRPGAAGLAEREGKRTWRGTPGKIPKRVMTLMQR